MSERTTGRRMLADLERRVGALEGDGSADPLAGIKREIEEATEKLAQRVKSIDRRLKDLEDAAPKEPENTSSEANQVEKVKKAGGRAKA